MAWPAGHVTAHDPPGAPYSVLAFWDNEGHSLSRWYINLEEPLHRTSLGFDYLDNLLDIVVAPDLSSWHWKDEDELQQAVEVGLITDQRAGEIRADGQRALDFLLSGKSAILAWKDWEPGPKWSVPQLPDGWNSL